MHNLQEVLSEDCSAESVSETPPLEAKKRKSMRRAINEYCKECIYDDCSTGNWKQQTGACTVTACPLYEFRPISKPRKANEPDLLDDDTDDEEVEA